MHHMDKDQAADTLEEIALLLELKGENQFKTRAYRQAARLLQTADFDVAKRVADGSLADLPGIGKALADKIAEFFSTGKIAYHEELKASFPATLPELFSIPGLGPKKIKALYDALGVHSFETLEQACQSGKVAELAGFGKKTQEHILEGIALRRSFKGSHRYGDVWPVAEDLVEYLRALPEVSRISLAGSFRRCKETLKDLDILVSSASPAAIMNAFVTLPPVQKIVAHVETKSSVILENGLPCDLRVVPDSIFPCALHHFTGSKEHNIAMRQRAIQRGMKLSEWGLFRAADEHAEPGNETPETLRVHCESEDALFRNLGLDFIPPELRENLGEIEASESGKLPRLVEWTDMRGTFHNHTNASDGKHSLEQMAEAARSLGLEYLGIADHSKSSFQANGLQPETLLKQVAQIRRLNETWDDFRLLAGSEVDILKDGSLDYDDTTLAALDYVVASIHQSFTLEKDAMTRRIIQAAEHPSVTMLGHLTGRLLLERNGYDLDIPKIIDACAANGTWIELNSNPMRLDMDWRWWKRARDKGVLCAINPDAHSTEQLGYLKFGVQIARKGWLRKEDVANTMPWGEMKKMLSI